MKHLLQLLLLAASAFAQTALTKEEQLQLELAQTQLDNIALKSQLLKAQQEEIQKKAQAIFEAACKRAGIEMKSCQFDPKTQLVAKKKPE